MGEASRVRVKIGILVAVIILMTANTGSLSMLAKTNPLPANAGLPTNSHVESKAYPGHASLVATIDLAGMPPLTESTQSSGTAPGVHSPSALARASRTANIAFAGISPSNVSITSGFIGLNSNVSGTDTPPDVSIGSGPNHVMEVVNHVGEVFSKQGNSIKLFSLFAFFNVRFDDTLADPRVMFDLQSGRWFASVIDFDNQNFKAITRASVLLGVSATSDPTAAWKIYAVSSGGIFPDQPIIGMSDDKLVVSVNGFAGGDGTFVGVQYWVLNKSEMTAGSAVIDFSSVGPDKTVASLHPVRSLSSTSLQWMVTVGTNSIVDGCTDCLLPKLISIGGVPPGPLSISATSISIAPSTAPPLASAPGGTVLNTQDTRVEDALWSQGLLWFAFNDGCTPPGDTQLRDCVRLTEVNTVQLSVLQDFDYGTRGTYYFFPAISDDANGDIVVVYGYSSTTVFPSLAVTGQAFNDPVGTLAVSQTLISGTAAFSGRYGDYFGSGVDPTDPTTIWVAGEYQALSSWSTFIATTTMVQGFSVSASPSSFDILAGSSAVSTVSLTSVAGFAGSVSLSSTVSPAGPSVTLSPTIASLPAGKTKTSTLSINTFSNTTNRPYSVTVTGTAGGQARTTVLFVIVGPDFGLTNSPTTMTIQAGSTGTSTISLTSINSFAGTVNLKAVVSPSGLTTSLTPPNASLTSGRTSSLTLSLSSPIPGFFTIDVRGTSGSLTHKTSLTVIVIGFGISASSANLALGGSSSVTDIVSVNSVWGFTGTVTLGTTVSPSGVTASISPASIPLGSGSTSPSTLTVSTSSSIPGLYTVTVTGANGPEAHTVSVVVAVTPITVTINNASTFTGITVKTTGSLSIDSPSTSFTLSGTASVLATNSTTGVTLFAKNYTLTHVPITPPGSFRFPFLLNINVNPYPLSSDVTIILSGNIASPEVIVSRNLDINGNGIVDITDQGILQSAYGCSTNMTCYNPRADFLAHGTVDGIDASLQAINFGVTDFIPNFSVTPNSTTIFLLVGHSNGPSIRIASSNGLSGTVSLIATPSFAGLAASLNPATITLAAGGTATSTLTLGSATLGEFSVNVTATSGILSHSFMLTVDVGDLILDCGNCSIDTPSPGILNFNVRSIDNLAGIVTLAASASPGMTVSLSTTKVSLQINGTGFVAPFAVTVRAVQGTYNVTVTATLGSLSRSLTVTVNIIPPPGRCCALQPALPQSLPSPVVPARVSRLQSSSLLRAI